MSKKPDFGHRLTDQALCALEKRIAAEYQKAASELTGKIDAYFESFKKRDAEQLQLMQDGKITKQQYTQWRLAQIGRGKRFEVLRDRVAERMTKANEVAAAYINDRTPGIYSLNRNYAAYTIEQQAGQDVGFDLWDEQTIRRLAMEQPDLMPYYPPKRAVKRGIDLAWGKRQITAQVTSGILQGESIKHLADRLQTNIPNMNRTSAIRAARTAVTGAQNAGRLDSYLRAEEMGIPLKKVWIATLDNRTRHNHAVADGQTVEEDKPFTVGGYELMYPGDPNGPGHEIYNCRCTMIAKVEGVDMSDAKRRARNLETGESELVEDMTYAEWAGWKKDTKQVASLIDAGIIEIVAPVAVPVAFRRFETGDAVNGFFYYDSEERGALQKVRSEHGQWIKSLSKDEVQAIRSYTANGYSNINGYWRRVSGWETIPADKVEDASRQIDADISRFHLKESITVQRGLDDFYGSCLVGPGEWNDIHEIVGMTYRDLGYGSSTALVGNRVATAKPYLLEIDIPAGTGRGAYVNKLAGQYEDKEYEFLIARGSKFEITDVVINEEPIPPQTIIRMRMIVDE